METPKMDHRSKPELRLVEAALRAELDVMYGRLQFINAHAHAVALARFIPFSWTSKHARKALGQIIAASTIVTKTDPLQEQHPYGE